MRDNLVRVYEDKRYAYDGHGRLIQKLSRKHTAQTFEWDEESRLTAVTTTRRPGTEHETTQTTRFDYDAIGRRVAKHDSFGTTVFIWEGMRLIEERRGGAVISYVYEPDSYVPLARLDAEGERTEQGGLGTIQDARQPGTSKTIAASEGQSSAGGQKHPNYSQQPANDTLEASYWQALNPKDTGQSTGTDGPSANANLCEVYYFHTDQVGLPEELSNAQGQIIWQAQYKTWGSTVEERWEARRLHGAKVQGQTEGDTPEGDRQEQNLRFQGQYLDRETGLHYNTFRYYDADIGRFISPDPIGLRGGINLENYAPNPISWIDPWGWELVEVNPGKVNYSQRTVSDIRVFDAAKYQPIKVVVVDGQMVSYDNRRLLAAQNAGLEKITVDVVDKNAPHPDSSTGKTWWQKFQERFKDRRNVSAGGVVPETGLREKPTLARKC